MAKNLQVIVKYLGKSAGKFPFVVKVGATSIARFATATHAAQYATALEQGSLPTKF